VVIFAVAGIASTLGCGRGAPATAALTARADPTPIRLTDVTAAAGLRFTHTSGRSGRLYFPETMGSGGAFLDYDGDGKLDIFLVNSSRLPGYREEGPLYPALYRNRGDGTFEDVTQKAGLVFESYGIGCAVGDYDGDGNPDLYVTAMGPNRLFRNDGKGHFTDVARQAGVGDPRFSTSAAWLDADRDGDLDLFIANYCHWTPALHRVCRDSAGHPHICGPTHFPGASNRFYRNNGDGTFTDVTRAAGLEAPNGKGLGILVWDENDDGWPDLCIANDQEPNLLYRNNRDGTFSERGIEAGVALSAAGKARAGMGIDAADPGNDGREAVAIGNLDRQGLALFLAEPGSGLFIDQAGAAGLFQPSLPFVQFGVLFSDVDRDGWKDLIVANGHVDENVAAIGSGATFAQRLLLFRNESVGAPPVRFREVGESAGLTARRVFRGIAAGDFDADGDPDFLVTVNGGAPLLLRNDSGAGRHWIQVRLRARGRNPDGLGSRVRVTAGGMTQTAWVRSGSTYASANPPVADFGLGATAVVGALEVRWPTGETEHFGGGAADRVVTLRQGTGEPRRAPPAP
jgi:hypothetical protein